MIEAGNELFAGDAELLEKKLYFEKWWVDNLGFKDNGVGVDNLIMPEFEEQDYYDLVYNYIHSFEYDIAQVALDIGLRAYPNDDGLTALQIKKYLRTGLLQSDRIESLLSKLSIDFDPVERIMIEGECYVATECFKEAEEIFAHIEVFTDDDEQDFYYVCCDIAEIYDFYDRYEDALEWIRKIDPEEIEDYSRFIMYKIQARSFYGIGDYIDAIESARHVIDIDAFDYEGWVILGKAYMEISGKENSVVEAADFAIAIDEKNPEAYFVLANHYSKIGLPHLVTETLQRIELNNDNEVPIILALLENELWQQEVPTLTQQEMNEYLMKIEYSILDYDDEAGSRFLRIKEELARKSAAEKRGDT